MSREALLHHPYHGRVAVLATKHGKEQQIARPLEAALGLHLQVPAGLDTDLLGTFTGEIARPGPPTEVVLQKARMGMRASGLPLGLANEGSFGPHPAFPLMTADVELLLWVDDERDIRVQEFLVSEQVVAVQTTAQSLDTMEDFLRRAHFPSHGLIVRPHMGSSLSPEQITKGIIDTQKLAQAIRRSAASSSDGLALVETDLRSHMNPTRQRVIRRLAGRLARRLACLCPCCATPGWGMVDRLPGLPCEWCGEATDLVREEIMGCPACSYREHRPRTDGLRVAPAGQCPFCNP